MATTPVCSQQHIEDHDRSMYKGQVAPKIRTDFFNEFAMNQFKGVAELFVDLDITTVSY